MQHTVLNHNLNGPFPRGAVKIMLGMGCFWGVERLFWQQNGVWVTAVGYAGGVTKNPVYSEVCSGDTGHAEVVMVCFDPDVLSLEKVLKIFFEHHNPTQDKRQSIYILGQYRSAIYTFDLHQHAKVVDFVCYMRPAIEKIYAGDLVTEIKTGVDFYLAEEYHQQYLDKNPSGYCSLQRHVTL